MLSVFSMFLCPYSVTSEIISFPMKFPINLVRILSSSCFSFCLDIICSFLVAHYVYRRPSLSCQNFFKSKYRFSIAVVLILQQPSLIPYPPFFQMSTQHLTPYSPKLIILSSARLISNYQSVCTFRHFPRFNIPSKTHFGPLWNLNFCSLIVIFST